MHVYKDACMSQYVGLVHALEHTKIHIGVKLTGFIKLFQLLESMYPRLGIYPGWSIQSLSDPRSHSPHLLTRETSVAGLSGGEIGNENVMEW